MSFECVLLIITTSVDYTGQGVDQLQKVIDTIKTNPEDRRIIMCAWNPKGNKMDDVTNHSKTDKLLLFDIVGVGCKPCMFQLPNHFFPFSFNSRLFIYILQAHDK